ncbi:hypothetical protein ASD21_15335 [Caulobacter sp. Root1455]|uniref:hypothetical protein n=1 Tax=unclassified Caulobacter TaxID=2648921 RepID=UPI0006FDD41A|nr:MULTISPECIES: hypothetical protein [unclassified Caulobacter]KQY27412.1 hypothetical protein ASD38_18745 [Caulobacter sp. Root487D2Y]KQY92743.1 hypothetical protein ASD21_15335 [Caulobacter sp. Root1455]
MQALPNPSAEPVERSAQIIPFAELNRARSLRALAQDLGAPAEPHPWAYVFPRPSQTLSSRT